MIPGKLWAAECYRTYLLDCLGESHFKRSSRPPNSTRQYTIPSSTSARDFAGDEHWGGHSSHRTVSFQDFSSFWLPHLDIAVRPVPLPFHEFHVGDLPAKEVKCRLERRYKLQIHAFHQKIFFFGIYLPLISRTLTINCNWPTRFPFSVDAPADYSLRIPEPIRNPVSSRHLSLANTSQSPLRLTEEIVRCSSNWQGKDGDWRRDFVWVQEYEENSRSARASTLNRKRVSQLQLIVSVRDMSGR
jgi:hypothetical protein